VAAGTQPARTDPSTARSPRKGGFRPDVEGLRAVAVLAVLLYRAGLDATSSQPGLSLLF
jgi:peptidoglycan/LPS O-acetylase OafA/YrhL